MSDFNDQLDDLLEYRKLVIKLEEALKQKDLENTKLSKINQDLTNFCNEMKSELNEQSSKLISKYSEIKNLTKKYEQQINNLNSEHEKEKQKYDEKIFELSSYNPQVQSSQIKNELESKYNLILKNKDSEITKLKNEINELKQNITLKETELKLLKKNLNDQLNTERETHLFQINDLLSKFNIQKEIEKSDNEKNILEELKLTIRNNEEKNELLYKQMEDIRKEKNSNEILYNRNIFELETKLKEEKFSNAILNDEKNGLNEDFNNLKKILMEKDYEINQIKEEYQKLFEEKNDLIKILEQKYENEEEMKKDLQNLKIHLRNLQIGKKFLKE